MRSRRTEQDYRARVARVVAAIVADPLAEHGLDELARLAHFSPFHFHRVYRSVVGESIAATLRRVRLAMATQLLSEGRESVTQVALAVGYESPQAFTRAFGQFTGQSPREFQQQMGAAILGGSAAFAEGSVPSVRLVERPAQQVLALRHRGPFSTIPHTHRRLRACAGAHPVSDWLGVSSGNPDHPGEFSYHAAMALSEPGLDEGPDLERLDIPAGLYAVHCLAGPSTRINAAVHALYARWLPASGYEPDDRPILEHYLTPPRQTPPSAQRTDLLIPIRAAG